MKKACQLIDEIFKEKGEGAFGQNIELRKRLEKLGPETVDLVLSELFKRKKTGRLFAYSEKRGSPLYHLIKLMKSFPLSPQQAVKLAEMLLWDEILVIDRSTRSIILEILESWGDHKAVPFLKAFARKVKGVPYDKLNADVFLPAEIYHRWDQQETWRTIDACQKR